MSKEEVNGIIEKFKNPALWLSLVVAFSYIAVQLNQVTVLDDRVTKKIAIINEMHEKIHTLEMRIVVLETQEECVNP